MSELSKERQDRWGRYRLPDPDTGEERPWTRATTLAEAMVDAYGLTEWKLRETVRGIGLREDLYELAAGSDPEDKRQLDGIVKDAQKAASMDARANRGTTLHKLTQRLDQGETVRAPKKMEPDVELYQAAKERWGILTAPTMCERITVVPELEVAGTFDKLVKYSGRPVMCDLKTGSDVERGGMKIAIQIAIYSRGRVLWNVDADRWDRMPVGVDQQMGLVFHLPVGAGVASLYEANLNIGWDMAKLAYDVREARKGKDYLNKVDEIRA